MHKHPADPPETLVESSIGLFNSALRCGDIEYGFTHAWVFEQYG